MAPANASGPSQATATERLDPTSIDAIVTYLIRNLGGHTTTDDGVLTRTVREAVVAFVEEQCVPVAAAQRVAPLLEEFGALHARRGHAADSLDAGFQKAAFLAQRGLQFATISHATLRQRAGSGLHTYVELLHRCARAGRSRVPSQAQSHHGRSATTGAAREGSVATPIPEDTPCRLVVSAQGRPLVPRPRDSRSSLDEVRLDPPGDNTQCLVPADMRMEQIGALVVGQVVLGPSATIGTWWRSAHVVTRAAALLSCGRVIDDRQVVPCTDLLGHVLIDGMPGLVELLVHKHLAPAERWAPQQRLRNAELLLAWLQRGVPLNRLARELNLPPQTAHNRFAQVKEAFGDVLEDPEQRLELLIALRSVLPRWRNERAHS